MACVQKKKIIRIYKKESNSCCNRHYCSLHTCTHTSARGQSFMYLFQNTLHVSHLSAQPRPVLRGGRHPALTRGTTTKPGLTALCWEDYIRASSQAKIPPIHHNDLLQWHSLAVYLAVYTDVSDVDRAVDYCYTWQMAVIRWSWNGTAQGREEELRGGKRFPKKEKKKHPETPQTEHMQQSTSHGTPHNSSWTEGDTGDGGELCCKDRQVEIKKRCCKGKERVAALQLLSTFYLARLVAQIFSRHLSLTV